jgi:hypothetical protein
VRQPYGKRLSDLLRQVVVLDFLFEIVPTTHGRVLLVVLIILGQEFVEKLASSAHVQYTRDSGMNGDERLAGELELGRRLRP